MLKNNLYTIIDKKNNVENTLEVKINIDAKHSIFLGHFPDQAVLPGVCLIEILKEIINEHLGKNYSLQSASNIKFLKIVDPLVNSTLIFNINYFKKDKQLEINATSSLINGDINFKIKGTYIL